MYVSVLTSARLGRPLPQVRPGVAAIFANMNFLHDNIYIFFLPVEVISFFAIEKISSSDEKNLVSLMSMNYVLAAGVSSSHMFQIMTPNLTQNGHFFKSCFMIHFNDFLHVWQCLCL